MKQTTSTSTVQLSVKTSYEKPPIYDKCKELFGIDWNDGIIFTYGDTIHCKRTISPDLLVHETTHVKQQSVMGPEAWWDKYFIDKEFRLDQEVEAYKNQLKFIYKVKKDRNFRFRALDTLARNLSSSTYGNMCKYSEAVELLTLI